MTIGILVFILSFIIAMTVIFILGCIGEMYEEDVAGDYARAMNKAIKDMEKGITTVINDEPNGAFSVEKYKDGKKL